MKARNLSMILATAAAVLFIPNAAAKDVLAEQVAKSQAAIINALVAGANIHAPEQLAQARRTLETARRLGLPALATQAESDAKLAEARAWQVKLSAKPAPHAAAAVLSVR